MSYFGNTKIGKMFLGSIEIGKAYLGDTLVFKKGGTPPIPGRLPAGYTEVQYIQFSNSYFDTGKYPNNDWKITSKWSRDSATNMYFYGALSNSNTASCTAYMVAGNNGYWRWKNRYVSLNPSVNVHETVQDNTGLTIDNTHMNLNGAVSAFIAPVTLAVGVQHLAAGGYGAYYFNGKVYSFKIEESGTSLMDLVPCINPFNVAGFYDLVSESFIGSLGSDFIAGPSI